MFFIYLKGPSATFPKKSVFVLKDFSPKCVSNQSLILKFERLTMKTTILTLAALFILASGFIFSNPETNSETASYAVGTITVCLNKDCPQPTADTQVRLRDASTNAVIDQCTIFVPNGSRCCNMTGDYPTGSYIIEYSQSYSSARCYTAPFNYTNGTNVTLEVVCDCP